MGSAYAITRIDRARIKKDGDGIRTLIVLHGCPLKCKYCFNKFTWDGSTEPVWMTAEELYGRVAQDRIYLLSTNGGVTFGGGEPLLQPQLIKDFAEINKEDFTINIETSLNVPWENVELVLDVVDEFIIDIKSLDPKVYSQYTAGYLDPVLNNLKILINSAPPDSIIVRIPVIPGITTEKDQERNARQIIELGILEGNIDLFEYKTGESESRRKSIEPAMGSVCIEDDFMNIPEISSDKELPF